MFHFQGIEILHDLGLSVSYSSLQKKRKILISEQENKIKDIVTSFKHARTANRKPIEVLGDNVDITVSPAKMTLDKQRKSLHWFLLMVKQRRVTYEDVHATDQVLQKPIEGAITADWIPSDVLVKGLESDFKHHISNILLKYIDFVKTNIQNYPEYLKHKYTHLTEKKSVVLNCDLIEESENSSQGMIKILQKVHELAVPHIERKVVEKVVFGGDVLTNERAFSAQEAMQNNNSDFENLLGIIHRPEGLHREMNFLMV